MRPPPILLACLALASLARANDLGPLAAPPQLDAFAPPAGFVSLELKSSALTPAPPFFAREIAWPEAPRSSGPSGLFGLALLGVAVAFRRKPLRHSPAAFTPAPLAPPATEPALPLYAGSTPPLPVRDGRRRNRRIRPALGTLALD